VLYRRGTIERVSREGCQRPRTVSSAPACSTTRDRIGDVSPAGGKSGFEPGTDAQLTGAPIHHLALIAGSRRPTGRNLDESNGVRDPS
jgi:hypothetical protein